MFTRAFRILFAPAAALIGRLRYAHKFAVTGLVLLIPLGFVVTAYVGLQRDQISFSAKERSGVSYMTPLLELAARLTESRHAAAVPGAAAVPLDDQMARVDAVDRRLGSALDVSGTWSATRLLMNEAQRATGTAADRYEYCNKAMKALLDLIVKVGDESNLTLDPDLDTYYLMDTLQFRLPVLLDAAGRSADLATMASARPAAARTDALIELGFTNGVIRTTRETITRSVATFAATTADADARERTVSGFRQLDNVTAALAVTVTAAVKNRQPDAVRVAAAEAVRVAAAEQAVQIALSLDRLLQVRIEGFAGRAHRIELTAGLAALLALYLFGGFYFSVVPPIRRIVDALHAVAAGDLTRCVSVDTHDELSFVARALNRTVAETKTVTDRLARQASHDALTGLPNRAVALDRIARILARTPRGEEQVAVLLIDLDRFKPINDSYGHHVGDEVLGVIAGRLTALLRDGDTAARLGGDEFLMLCEGLESPADAVRIGEAVVAELSRPITAAGGHTVSVGASVGVSYAGQQPGQTAADLVCDADVAMYRAKQLGRGRVETFDDALRTAVERRLQTQEELRYAVERGEIVPYFQPIVNVETTTIYGFEALARWQHPTRGLLGPAEFIEVAEEVGLIVPVGAAILARACAEAVRWSKLCPDGSAPRVTVNVASAQLVHPSFVPTVVTILDDCGLDPDRLWLEITETSIMADTDAAAETFRAMRALGVHLAVDDFGTGYSSLTYLRRFPVETLKVDRSFVAGIGCDREDEAIVGMILSLARALELQVVAEGVETADQLDQLRRLGCVLVQGFWFGRPMSADEARNLVSRPQPIRT
ncbi:putative bifunctional diguanylate cyclase/phosphodiesterase [Actinoplanes solisilvae]|uniref:putative bifunctional diguanylate cyclase/phosphodiesterase n=1 Tax=Actinoplanes solisilvae TaxID=2486853 RepID=UPI0013E2A640|nr:GGDEF domain-containing protein [Actinoplanes solisilvae]